MKKKEAKEPEAILNIFITSFVDKKVSEADSSPNGTMTI